MWIGYYIDLFHGPFNVSEGIEVYYENKSEFGILAEEKLEFNSLLIKDSILSIEIRRTEEKVLLHLPPGTLLQEGTPLGWKVLWDGRNESSNDNSKGANQFDFTITPQGWWRISIHSETINLLFRPKAIPEIPFLGLLKWILTSSTVGMTIVALGLHGLTYYMVTKGPKLFGKKTIPVMDINGQNRVTRGAIPIEGSPDYRKDFSGMGLFSAFHSPEKPTSIASSASESLEKIGKIIASGNIEIKKSAINAGIAMTALPTKKAPPKPRSEIQVPVKAQKVNWNPVFFAQKRTKSDEAPSDAQLQALLDAFRKLQDPFRTCYERALVKYEDLSVSVSIAGEIIPAGHIGNTQLNVSGNKSSTSEKSLVDCLQNAMEKPKFKKWMYGVHFKNQFIFKS